MNCKSYIYSIFAASLLLGGCTKDFLDINDNPNQPTSAELGKLLTGVQRSVGYAFAPGCSGDIDGSSLSILGSILSSYTFHLSSREVDNYSITNSYSTLGNTWSNAYINALCNNDAVIVAAEASDNKKYAGVAKIQKAYVFAGLVDLWGDIPFTEFNIPGLYKPKADKSEDIYNACIALIEEGIADLLDETSANLTQMENCDIFYGGNITKWVKAANTLKLKLLVNSRNAKADITEWNSKLTQLLNENNFIGNDEDWQLKHSTQDNPDERNAAFVDEYLGGQSTYYISPWIYETMKGLTYNVTENPFENIEDPRVPYYWVNQLSSATAEAQNETDYRHEAFVSIFFASGSSYSSNAQRETSTFIGIYPCGGKFDNGSGGRCGASSGTGTAPDKMLQAYSVPFLKAELILTEGISGDAKAELEDGIRRAIYHVNSVSQAAKGGIDVPSISASETDDFVSRVLKKYDAADAEGKLNIVMTQKWIANFFNAVEAYTDMRRTGYPVVPKTGLRNAVSPYSSEKAGTPEEVNIPLKSIIGFPRAMWYPFSEVSRNPNITNEGRILQNSLIFWDK